MIAHASSFPQSVAYANQRFAPSPAPAVAAACKSRRVLCTLLGLAPSDVAVPYCVLKLSMCEQNPATIEQRAQECFARVITIQHRIDRESMRWMMQVIADARTAMQNAVPQQPVCARFGERGWTVAERGVSFSRTTAAPMETQFRFPTVVRRRRVGGDLENIVKALAAFAMCVLALVAGVWFVQTWFDDLPKNREPMKAVHAATVAPKRPSVPDGAGAPAAARAAKKTGQPAKPGPEATLAASKKTEVARESLAKALVAAQQGSFDEARRLAVAAARGMPDEAEALQLMLEYGRQYSELTDQARLAPNGSSEVDLEKSYGKGQFVQQDVRKIVFFLQGRHQEFSIHEFNGLPGVRFCVTRDLLERRRDLPANDLILGSYQYLLQLNRDGLKAPEACCREAESRFRRASGSGDAIAREHGTQLMKLLNLKGRS